MRKAWETFLVALMYYTRIPISYPFQNLPALQAQSILYFPIIGWFVGAVGALIFQGTLLFFPVSVALLLSMTSTLLLTGALHEDGFADSCDGFGGGWRKEDILAIMKDPRIGSYGNLGLVMILALKYVTLWEIESALIPSVLIVAHSLSRATAASLLFNLEYVGTARQSKARALLKRLSWRELGTIVVLGVFPLLCFLSVAYLFLVVPLFFLQIGLKTYFQKRLGGYTGDCLGATQQLAELVIYLYVLANI